MARAVCRRCAISQLAGQGYQLLMQCSFDHKKFDRLISDVASLKTLVKLINIGVATMTKEVDDLKAAFDRHDAEIAVVVDELKKLAAVTPADPAVASDIEALAARLDASTKTLGDAVTAVAPAPVAPPAA